ncbi:MAG: hypothetical protein ABR928_00020 [Terracidiphilus sp.]
MTALRAHLSIDFRSRRRFVGAIAGLCLTLLTMLAVAQVAHLHANDTDADHCQLCIVMHTAVPAVAAAAVVVMVQLESLAPAAEPVLILHKRQIRLFIRPPPVSC